MAPNQNFDNYTFLVGPDLVQKQSFIKISIFYLASAFGTSRPRHKLDRITGRLIQQKFMSQGF